MKDNRFKPLLKWKILTANAVFLALIAIVFLWSLENLKKLGAASQEILQENYNSIIAAEKMIGSVERQDSISLILFSEYNPDLMNEFKENEREFFVWLKAASENVTIDGERKIVDDLSDHYKNYLDTFYQFMVAHYQRVNTDSRRHFYLNTLMAKFQKVRNSCIDLRNLNQNTMFKTSEQTKIITQKSRTSLTVISGIVLLIGIFLSLFFSHIFSKPVQEMTEALGEISQGNYDVKLDVKSTDEFGQLAAEFNKMTQKILLYQNLNIRQLITETKKNEAIINRIDDGIIVIDEECRITNINIKASNIFHVSQTEALNRHFLEVIREEDLFNDLKAVLSGNKRDYQWGEKTLEIDYDKKKNYFQYTITPLYMKKEPVLGAVILITDITKYKNLDKMKSEFVMAASHELRTPLTGVQMSINLLDERIKDKELKKLVNMVNEEINRLRNLIEDLLNLSKIESGQIPLNYEKCSLEETVNKALAILSNQIRKKGINVISSFKHVPLFYYDHEKIVWVIVNLVGNAIRYSPENSIIKVNGKILREDCYVTVEDRGGGINEKDIPRIFDRFFQSRDKEKQGGSGLGLSITREIIHAHKGAIWVESVEGSGSKFIFTLPLRLFEEEE